MKLIDIHISNDKVYSSKVSNSKVVVAIGNFDGLHKGHAKLLQFARDEAVKRKLPFGIITFDPHPRDFFSKSKTNFLLTDFLEKKRLCKNFGIDYFFKIKFNDSLRILSPENFVKLILKNMVNTDCIFAGENFRFGKNREGSLRDEDIFQKYNIYAKICKLFSNKNEQVVSSELIRKSILSLDFKFVKSCLGHNWAVTGNVQRGDQNGRKLGFATANLQLLKTLEPKFGVYLTRTRIMKQDGSDFISEYMPSITNFGIRPTLDGQKKLFETHILNYEAFLKQNELYNCRIFVELLGFLREEIKFNSFENLRDQILNDVKMAKQFHENK